MKCNASCLLICLLFFIDACKKDSPAASNNELKATISAAGQPDIFIEGKGRWAMFTKYIRPSGDTTYGIVAGEERRVIEISLGKIRGEGTYKFTTEDAAGAGAFAYCSWVLGNPINPYSFYTTTGHDSTSTITITNLTATHMAGYITAVTCGTETDEVVVKDLTFTGDFTP